MWHTHDLDWGWWLLMSVGMLAFWALIIFGAVWLARSANSQAPTEPRPQVPESPQQVLKRRLAAGDIDVDEYERRRALLDDESAMPPPASAALH